MVGKNKFSGLGLNRISLEILTADVYVVTVVLNNDEPVSKRLILRR
mgnify:CR=1 FL=1